MTTNNQKENNMKPYIFKTKQARDQFLSEANRCWSDKNAYEPEDKENRFLVHIKPKPNRWSR